MSPLFDTIAAGISPVAYEMPLEEKDGLLRALDDRFSQPVYFWSLATRQWQQLVGGDLVAVGEFSPLGWDRPAVEHFEAAFAWMRGRSGIFVLDNVLSFLEGNTVARSFLESTLLDRAFKQQPVILIGAEVMLTPALHSSVPLLVQPLPNREAIAQLVGNDTQITNAARGLYRSEIEMAIALAAKNPNFDWLDFKAQRLHQRCNVEFVPRPTAQYRGAYRMQETFAGFGKLLEVGLPLPHGAAIGGPPGTGKSYFVRRAAELMGVVLLALDWGSLIALGEAKSEARLRQVLATAESIAPCILYLDDMDKGMVGGSDTLMGKLLQWLNDREADVLTVGSLNRLEKLPPELTRAGRFDYLFLVDLPTCEERKEVLHSHLARRDDRFVDGEGFEFEQWQQLVRGTNKYTPSELAALVTKACDRAAIEGREVTVKDLLAAKETTFPLAIREADRVAKMRRAFLRAGATIAAREDTSEWARPKVIDLV